jgi:hypothetical protein
MFVWNVSFLCAKYGCSATNPKSRIPNVHLLKIIAVDNCTDNLLNLLPDLGFALYGFELSLYSGTPSEGEFALFLARPIS